VKVEGDRAIMLRPGGVSAEAIERVIGRPLGRIGKSVGVEAPGMMASHYAPAARLRLDAGAPGKDEAFLAFGPAPNDHPYTLQLSEDRDLVEAAANLFAHLAAADALCRERALKGIAVAAIPATGLGEAINDRLKRAASPKPA
jgi:L-threonylcarbamoyladenylate synthase